MVDKSTLGAAALLVLLASGCGQMAKVFPEGGGASPPKAPTEEDVRPRARPEEVRKPPENARSAEEFDTTTREEREAAAAAPEDAGEMALGSTVASLGDPARPGFWLETPLVNAAAQGRVEFPETGKSAQVELIPIEGEATAGSRISLAAMRLIGAPLTGLPTLLVFKQ